MHLSTLSEWLSWIESVHAKDMDLGLDRVKKTAERLGILTPDCPVITVGGTNGKGSTVAGLESIYLAAGYHVGAFTSPILFKHNEQVRLDGQMASDEDFCAAFEKVEQARGDISLTMFEFCTLAALVIFKKSNLDVWILEVGLGGRLDAVNIIDADVAVITSIGIDHVAWLGHTREQIGYEKAGIFREEHPAVCGDFDPPATVIERAADLDAPFYQQGRDFDFESHSGTWTWSNGSNRYDGLPYNELAIQNMSTVLMAVTLLNDRLPVTREDIENGLRKVKLPGRIQIIMGEIMEIFDVSHNPAAITFLKNRLDMLPCHGETHAVFSMLADKDIIASILAIKGVINQWYVAPLSTKRAATDELLEKSFTSAEISNVTFFPTITDAYKQALKDAKKGDRIIVFGSFHTVADVWRCKNE